MRKLHRESIMRVEHVLPLSCNLSDKTTCPKTTQSLKREASSSTGNQAMVKSILTVPQLLQRPKKGPSLLQRRLQKMHSGASTPAQKRENSLVYESAKLGSDDSKGESTSQSSFSLKLSLALACIVDPVKELKAGNYDVRTSHSDQSRRDQRSVASCENPLQSEDVLEQ